ncbi:MAG: hypothetical protein ACI9X0_002799 [Kiritimatiellia bacterium]|jgi:hypothetical protein
MKFNIVKLGMSMLVAGGIFVVSAEAGASKHKHNPKDASAECCGTDGKCCKGEGSAKKASACADCAAGKECKKCDAKKAAACADCAAGKECEKCAAKKAGAAKTDAAAKKCCGKDGKCCKGGAHKHKEGEKHDH